MAKHAHYTSVEDWVTAEFSIKTGNAGHLDEATLSTVGQVLRRVHPKSLAGILGLQKGDILHALNGGAFESDDLKKTFKRRLLGRPYTFDFLRPSSREKLRIKGSTFPFGAQYGQSVNGFAVELRNGDPDIHDISQFWTGGPDGALAKLWPFFEAYNLRIMKNNGSPFDGPLPQVVPPTAPLAGEQMAWPGVFAWLALCAAHAEQWERAAHVLGLVEEHFDRSGDSGMMSMFAAMAYTRSMLAEQKGFTETALSHIHHAIEMSPETQVLYKRLSALSGQSVTPPPSPYPGVKPIYDLPRHDPTQKLKQPAGQVSLRDTVNSLAPGERVLICVMSSYRTNGPYIEGFERALIPLSRLRDRFREVHIITSWDEAQSRDLPWPIMEPQLIKAGVDVSVLFDKDQSLSEQLSLISAPTNLVIDHNGIILAEGWLGDDALLWDSL